MNTRKVTFVFAIYLLLLGAILFLIPNPLLELFGLPQTEEVWVRVVGMLVCILSWYYYSAAKTENTDFLKASIPGRMAVLVMLTALVLAGQTQPIMILFGVIDAAFAGVTWKLLRDEFQSNTPSAA